MYATAQTATAKAGDNSANNTMEEKARLLRSFSSRIAGTLSLSLHGYVNDMFNLQVTVPEKGIRARS